MAVSSDTNPLKDLIPARVRQVAYAILFVAALIFAAYQAADGNWEVFVGSLLTSGLGLLAASNISAPDSHLKQGDSLPGFRAGRIDLDHLEGETDDDIYDRMRSRHEQDRADDEARDRRYDDPFDNNEFEDGPDSAGRYPFNR